MNRAQPKLDFIPPAFNPLVLRLIQWSLPILKRFRLKPWLPAGISKVETINGKTLAELYQQFQIGKIRLILAFRHCEVDDPLVGQHLLSRSLPKIARRANLKIKPPFHGHFMYDRGMTIWAGDWLGWVFSRIGGVPVHRGKNIDLQAIKKVRELLVDGRFPLVVAPEGATNGHSEIVSPLEPGVAQLAFWCAEDLAKASRVEKVIVLPVNLQYHYVDPQWSKLDRLLSGLEEDCGLPKANSDPNSKKTVEIYYERLLTIGEYLLDEMERFYRCFYHKHFAHSETNISQEENITIRLQQLLDISLEAAEEYFGLTKKGNIIERCRRIEEAGWNYVYRGDAAEFDQLSPVQRGLREQIAVEADLRTLHMRLVESFVAVTGTYIKEKPSFERFAETSLILFDAVARIKGNKNPSRPRLGWRSSTVTVGTPINISDRLSQYQSSRKAAKQSVNQLTQDLQKALENMIIN